MTDRLTEADLDRIAAHTKVGGEECDDFRGRLALTEAADAIAQLRQDLAESEQRGFHMSADLERFDAAREELSVLQVAYQHEVNSVNKLRQDLAEARDCGQDVVCKKPPGCQRHWEERNRELVADLATIRTQNAALEIDRQHAVCKMRNMERERDEARRLIAEYAVACREYSDAEDDYLEGDVTTTLERVAEAKSGHVRASCALLDYAKREAGDV